MDVTLRSVNDVFLERVVFPAFEAGARSVERAVGVLLETIVDEALRVRLELLAEERGAERLCELNDERWVDTIYRLLFTEWVPDGREWVPTALTSAFVGSWAETTTLALMLEDPSFDYVDAAAAEAAVRAFWSKPRTACPLASMLCGVWSELSGFDPASVPVAGGERSASQPGKLLRANWTWRSAETVAEWAARLPSGLSRLLEREVRRLRPVAAPERHAILDYWLGRVPEPPSLTVCFSGLGARNFTWIRQMGALAQHVRSTAAAQRGLTLVLTPTDEPNNTLS